MSMGYDYDDPREEETRKLMAAGYWKLKPGEKPNVHASKFRAGALGSSRKVIIR